MSGFPAGLTGVSYMATVIVIQWLGLESGGDLNLLECLRMSSVLVLHYMVSVSTELLIRTLCVAYLTEGWSDFSHGNFLLRTQKQKPPGLP